MILQIFADAGQFLANGDAVWCQLGARPMPDTINNCGEASDPADKITSRRAVIAISSP